MDQNQQAAAIPSQTRPVFEYDGRVSELFGIFLLNLLLTIVTLGIYRFWAITRIRRYLWSHMRFEGTRLSYTGKGKELFFGFLLAMTILGLFFAGAGIIAAALVPIHPGLAAIPLGFAYLCMFALYGAATFSAQRYRLSRTEWRGIRGGMEGSALRYGLVWLGYLLLVIVTLYQATPWMQVGLARARINASRFGSSAFHFEGRGGRLYPVWLAATLGNLLLLGVIVAAVTVFEWPVLAPIFEGKITGPEASSVLRRALPIIVAGIVAFSIASGLLVTWYFARLARLLIRGTSLAVTGAHGESTLRFNSTVNAGSLLWLFVSNALILVFTLGLGLPVTLHRSARYLARTTLMTGEFDANALMQSTLARPAVGEGFLQALDPGVI
jgi:uncharacterized membrane protein YjgN (DUF898 family)